MKVDAQSLLDAGAARELAATSTATGRALGHRAQGPADTVWMGVIDGDGRAVSFIQSIYHEYGSGVVFKDDAASSGRTAAAASRSIDRALNALGRGASPSTRSIRRWHCSTTAARMVYGNMGGDGQPQSQSAVFTRYACFGMNPQEAMSAPRWLLGRTWGQTSDTLKLEARFPPEVMAELRRYGHEVEVLQDWDETMGHAGAIVRHRTACLKAAPIRAPTVRSRLSEEEDRR